MLKCMLMIAFGTAHRAHGTTAVIAEYFPKDKIMFGFLINSELAAMDKVSLMPSDHLLPLWAGQRFQIK